MQLQRAACHAARLHSSDDPLSVTSTAKHRNGLLLAALAATLFSAKALLAKFLYRHGIDAITLMAFRMLFSLPVFVVVAIFETRRAQARGDRLSTRECALIVLLGTIGYYLSSLLDFWGLQYIPAALERLILFLTPTIVLLLSALVLRKRISTRQWQAMLLSYSGLVLVFWESLRLRADGLAIGSTLVMAAAICYSIYLILSGELVTRVGSLRLVAYAMCVSTVITLAHYIALYPLSGLIQPTAVYWLSAANALFCTVLPVFLTMFAISRIGAAATAQLSVIGPVSLVFLGWWLLGESVSALQMLGTAVVIAGVLVVLRANALGVAQKPPAAPD